MSKKAETNRLSLFTLSPLYLDFPNQYLGLNGDFCELGPVDFFLVYVK